MKTAKEWFDDMKARPCVTENDLRVIIGQIYLDGYKAGMIQAAEIARPMFGENFAVMDAILAARDAKTIP